MRTGRKWVVLIGLVLIGCSKDSVHADSKQEKESWNTKMNRMALVMSELMEDLTQSKKPIPEATKKRIQRNSAFVAEMAHEIRTGKMKDADPTLSIISNMFEDEVNRAHQAISGNHFDYGARLLRGISKYCIGCHTRTNPSSEAMQSNFKMKGQFTPFEKAEYLAASFQFDEALKEFESVLGSRDLAKKNPLEWEKMLKRSLVVTIRSLRSPEKTLHLLKVAQGNKSASALVRKKIDGWLKWTQAWNKEKKSMGTDPQSMVQVASGLIEKAQKQQDYPLDPSTFVLYLRASALLHAALKTGQVQNEAQVLAWLGEAYEASSDLELWTLHEIYFESCIRKAPKTDLAQKCYERYENSLVAGYSGSAGTQLPEDVQNKLGALKKLSTDSKSE